MPTRPPQCVLKRAHPDLDPANKKTCSYRPISARCNCCRKFCTSGRKSELLSNQGRLHPSASAPEKPGACTASSPASYAPTRQTVAPRPRARHWPPPPVEAGPVAEVEHAAAGGMHHAQVALHLLAGAFAATSGPVRQGEDGTGAVRNRSFCRVSPPLPYPPTPSPSLRTGHLAATDSRLAQLDSLPEV